jgi:hypothetical protein
LVLGAQIADAGAELRISIAVRKGLDVRVALLIDLTNGGVDCIDTLEERGLASGAKRPS